MSKRRMNKTGMKGSAVGKTSFRLKVIKTSYYLRYARAFALDFTLYTPIFFLPSSEDRSASEFPDCTFCGGVGTTSANEKYPSKRLAWILMRSHFKYYFQSFFATNLTKIFRRCYTTCFNTWYE